MSKPTRSQPPLVSARRTTNRHSIQQARTKPVAPPVYRPQPTPKVLQQKIACAQPCPPPSNHPHAAPPVYRPQPAPKCLQPKAAATQQTAPRRVNVTPPVHQSKPTPKVLQMKADAGRPAPSAQSGRRPVAPPVYRPQAAPMALQPKQASNAVAPARRAPAQVIQRVSFKYTKLDNKVVEWDPAKQDDHIRFRKYMESMYKQSNRKELRRLREEINQTQSKETKQKIVGQITSDLNARIDLLKEEKKHLRFQISQIPPDAKQNKTNRMNVSVFLDGNLIFSNNQGRENSKNKDQPFYFCYRSGHDDVGVNAFPEGTNDLPEYEVSSQDSEVKLLNQVEQFLTQMEPSGSKCLLLQLYSVNGSCDQCKVRIKAAAERLLARGWQKIAFKTIYERRSQNANRNLREVITTTTAYGHKDDPFLTWKEHNFRKPKQNSALNLPYEEYKTDSGYVRPLINYVEYIASSVTAPTSNYNTTTTTSNYNSNVNLGQTGPSLTGSQDRFTKSNRQEKRKRKSTAQHTNYDVKGEEKVEEKVKPVLKPSPRVPIKKKPKPTPNPTQITISSTPLRQQTQRPLSRVSQQTNQGHRKRKRNKNDPSQTARKKMKKDMNNQ